MWPDVLLHTPLTGDGAGTGTPTLVLALTTFGVLAAALAGLLLGHAAQQSARHRALVVPFTAGVLVFILFGLLKEAAGLGQGLLHRPLLQVGLILAFAAGAVLVPALSGDGTRPGAVVWLWALGISAHGAGEGWVIGTEAASADVLVPLQAASFLGHKFLEAFTIPVVAGVALSVARSWALAGTLAAAALLGGVLGVLVGPGVVPLLLFAAGAGAATYVILRLATRADLTWKGSAAVTLGVVLVYLVGLLHEL